MEDEIQEKIERNADEWLQKTGKESLTESLDGCYFVADCYRDLSLAEKAFMTETEFLDRLQNAVADKF